MTPDPSISYHLCGRSRDELYAMLSDAERVAVRTGRPIEHTPGIPDASLELRRECRALWARLDELIAAKRRAERDQKARRMRRRHEAARRKGRAA